MGTSSEVEPVLMDFCHNNSAPLAYETLLEAIYKADQSVAVRFDEIEYSWKIIDAIKAANLPLYSYQSNTQGPEELEKFLRKHKIR